MRNLLNNPKFVGALCVIALIMVYVRLFDSKPTFEPKPVAPAQEKSAPSPPVAASSKLPSQTAEIVSQSNRPKGKLLDVGWPKFLDRDPFQLVRAEKSLSDEDVEELLEDEREGEQASPPQEVLLQAVFLDGPTRLAMINRALVKEGEQVEGYVVDQIQRDRVLLIGEEESRWLEFTVTPKNVSSESS